jgi:hypothetical protein
VVLARLFKGVHLIANPIDEVGFHSDKLLEPGIARFVPHVTFVPALSAELDLEQFERAITSQQEAHDRQYSQAAGQNNGSS